MPVRKQVLSFISLLSLAVLIASFQTTSVSALSLDSHHLARDLHHHELAKKKRSTKQKRCKSRPAPSSASVSSSAPSKTPAVTPSPAPAPASSSTPPPAHSSAPPPAPKPTSAAPPKAPQSSSGSVRSLSSILPNKALLAWGADPSGLSAWSGMDAYYNWGPTSSGPGGPPFMPMLWGSKNTQVWNSQVVPANPPPAIARFVNEPELAGSNSMSPQDAAALWNECMMPLFGKSQLGGPAITSDPAAIGWVQTFIQSCNNGHANCGMSFFDYHWYGTDAQDLISAVQNIHNTFGMDIMISEFACQSFTGGPPCTQDEANAFAATATEFFRSTSYVIGYAAFGAVDDITNTGVSAVNSLFSGNNVFIFLVTSVTPRDYSNMKLPPTVKHLLTLRKPQANPSPSWERLHGVFTPTLAKATRHNARDGWLVLATSTLLTANVPSAVSHLYRYVSRREPLSNSAESLLSTEERTAQAAVIREAALKSVIFVGVILTLEALSGALEDDVKSSLRKIPYRAVDVHNAGEFTSRGRALWKHIYAPHDVKLADKLAGYHPDFMSFITTSYGVVFSPWFKCDPGYGPGNLSRTLGSIVGVACLRTETGVGPQLISHVYGLLKSGVEYEGEPPTEGEKWLASDEGTEWVLNSIDEISDVARSDPELKAKL